MPEIPIAPRLRAIRYDGTNHAEIITAANAYYPALGSSTVASAINVNPGVGFTMREVSVYPPPYNEPVFVVGTWAVFDLVHQGQVRVMPAAEFTAAFWTFGETAAFTCASTAFTTALAATASGFGSLPSITVPGLGNANFDVPIRPIQSSTAFTAVPFLTGSSSLLGALSITGLTAGTVPNANKLSTVINGTTVYDRVRVNVANSGALQLSGAALLVHITP